MKDQSIPLFVKVAETIRSRIQCHEYRPGDFIPSARELEREFKVSNITIRRAMKLLARQGLIIPRRGTRAKVAEGAGDIVEIAISGDFRSWVDMAVGRKLGVTTKILERRVVDGPEPIRRLLDLEAGEKLERIKRIRQLKGKPISYYVSYGSSGLLTKIPGGEIVQGTFVDAFQASCAIRLTVMEQQVRAAVADIDLAEILQINFGAPLFAIRNVYFAGRHRAMAVTEMYYRADHYAYTMKRKL